MNAKASFIVPDVFIVKHQNGNEAFWVEYSTAEAAQEAAEFIASTQGGSTTVFAAAELRSYWRGSYCEAWLGEPGATVEAEATK
jgi:hypothetical protein